MIKLRNVFGAFDGMSGGQIALNRQGIKYNKYYASEVDKWAIQVTQSNYPDTIQLGDITKVGMLPKIDLMMGGSPCTNFSFSGKQQGMSTKENIEILTLEHYLELKEKGFEFQGQSYLFWEYMRMLKLLKPKYFLLENVMMSKKWKDVLTKAIGVEPIMINSNLVSAQNRKRLYWTNIPNVSQPEDRGILLKDIIYDDVYKQQDQTVPKDYTNTIEINPVIISKTIKFYKDNPDTTIKGFENYATDSTFTRIRGNMRNVNQKSHTMTSTNSGNPAGNGCTNILHQDKTWRKLKPQEYEACQTVPENYTNPKYKISQYSIDKYIPDVKGQYCDPYNKKMLNGAKSTTLRLNSSNGNMWVNDKYIGWRKLTPEECELLQTVDLKFTKNVSDTQRYKMLGNGWTIDVITHILSFIP